MKERRFEYRARLREKKMKLKCVECGLDGATHWPCLNFHHVSEDKYDGISKMVSNLRPWKLIEEEMAKCVVLCSNCHQMKHYRDKYGEP